MFNNTSLREKVKVAMKVTLGRILSLIVAGSESQANKLQEISNEIKELKQSQANLEEGIVLTQTLCEEILHMLDHTSTIDMLMQAAEEDHEIHSTMFDALSSGSSMAVDKDWIAAFGDRPMKKDELN